MEISVPSFFLAPQLVVGTDRITTITTRLALKYAEILPLKLVPLPIEIPGLVELLHWHRAHDQDPAHIWFRGVLKDAVASMPTSTTKRRRPRATGAGASARARRVLRQPQRRTLTATSAVGHRARRCALSRQTILPLPFARAHSAPRMRVDPAGVVPVAREHLVGHGPP